MAMNKYMHPRNIYKIPPDFKKLADQFPQFSSICRLDVTGKITVDFKDPQVLRVLTACLLKSDFELDVSIPDDRLVPTLPLRLNYILWIEDLLESFNRSCNIKGIDIGTGACAIYPLLAAKKNNWHMIGTETDDESLKIANKNVKQNNLENLIALRKNQSKFTLKYLFLEENLQYDFCMCNPPFYVSLQEVWESRSPARPPPKNGFTGSPQELVTEGGELQFCRQILEESQELKENILIFTTMIGHKYNLKEFLIDLKAEGIKYATTEFCQGRVTRWGVAWSFHSWDLSKLVTVRDKAKKKNCPITFVIPKVPNQSYTMESVSNKLKNILDDLKIQYKIMTKRKNELCLNIIAYTNSWSHQRRKRRLQKQLHNELMKKPKMGCIINTKTPIIENNGIVERSLEHQLKDDFQSIEDCYHNDDFREKFEESNKGIMFSTVENNTGNNVDIIKGVNTSPVDTSSNISSEIKIIENISKPNPLSQAIVKLNWKEDLCSLSIEYLGGTGGKESVHQILQFIKNNWNKL